MHTILKGALVGAAAGGFFGKARARRRSTDVAVDQTELSPTTTVLKGLVFGGLAGAAVAVGLDRRSRARAAELAEEGVARGRELARQAQPALAAAYEGVSEQLHEVGDTVTDSLLPSVAAAAERAWQAVSEAADVARPVLHDALDTGKDALGAAQANLGEVAGTARTKVDQLVR